MRGDQKFDPNAGYLSLCDFLLEFDFAADEKESPSPGNPRRKQNLLAAEIKHFDSPPSEQTWFLHTHSLLAQLLCNMFGARARLGLYLCNFGLKLLLVEPPTDPDGVYQAFVWDGGLEIAHFSREAQADDVFAVLSEIVRLSIPKNDTNTSCLSPAANARVAAEAEKDEMDERKRAVKKQRTEKMELAADAHSSEDYRFRLQTREGGVVEISSLDIDSLLTREEQKILVEVEQERQALQIHEEDFAEISEEEEIVLSQNF